MSTALRLAAVAVWIAFLVALATWGDTAVALLWAVAGTFALGAVVGRWWVLLAVLIPGLGLAIMSAAAGTENTGHGSGVDWALWFFVPATLFAAAVMALGVLVHRLVLRGRRSASGRGPVHAR